MGPGFAALTYDVHEAAALFLVAAWKDADEEVAAGTDHVAAVADDVDEDVGGGADDLIAGFAPLALVHCAKAVDVGDDNGAYFGGGVGLGVGRRAFHSVLEHIEVLGVEHSGVGVEEPSLLQFAGAPLQRAGHHVEGVGEAADLLDPARPRVPGGKVAGSQARRCPRELLGRPAYERDRGGPGEDADGHYRACECGADGHGAAAGGGQHRRQRRADGYVRQDIPI